MTVRILAGSRTIVSPIRGALSHMALPELAAPVIQHVLKIAGIAPAQVDELILGNALGAGGNPARLCALAAGLPTQVAGLSVDRQCVSGLDAIRLGVAMISAGMAEIVVAGGVESYSQRPVRMASVNAATVAAAYDRPAFAPDPACDPDPAQSMRDLANQYHITRQEMDQWAIESHAKALAHKQTLSREILALGGAHDPYARKLSQNVCDRAPVLAGPITFANTAISADGAAFVVLASDRLAQKLGRDGPEIIASCTIGADPAQPGLAPVQAIQTACVQAQIAPRTLDLVELMEAYAVQAMLCARLADLPRDRINTKGGALARGHPIAASGAILAVRLVHDMANTSNKTGLAAIAAVGGLGSALILKT